MAKLVGAPRHTYMASWAVLWQSEIRDFWDVRVGKDYKCPQMNTMKVLVHESFEFGGFCTWPSWSVHHGILDGLVGSFVKNWNSWFLRCDGWIGPNCAQMNAIKVLVHESFEFGGFCTWPSWLVHHVIARWLGGEFCDKMKFVIFEMWGLERPTNVPKWIPWKSWCTKVLSSEGFALGQVRRCTTA